MIKTVLFVTDSLNLGGAERQLVLLAENLPRSWRPVLITFCTGSFLAIAKHAGIITYVVKRKARYDVIGPFRELKELIGNINPDIVHSWGWMSTMISATILYNTNIPLISGVVRLGGVPDKKRLRIKIASRLGSLTIANSVAGLRAWKVPLSRGRVVYNGFDWNRVLSADLLTPATSVAFNVIMIASMAPRKDWEAYVRLAEFAYSQYHDRNIIFTGYGSGPLRSLLLERSKDIRSTGTLLLPGNTENPIKACFQSNIGVLLSTYGEGISNTIMEYMACELPVICSNSGGNSELIEDGVTGFLVGSSNPPEQILDKIVWLQDHPKESKRMGAAGKKRLQNTFSVDTLVKSTIDVYMELL